MSSMYGQPTTPAPKPQRPWYKKKRVLIPGGFVALVILGSAVGGEDTSGTEAKPKPAVTVTKTATPPASPTATKEPTAKESRKAPTKEPVAAETEKAKVEPVPAVVGMSVSKAISELHDKGYLADEESISPGNWWIADNSNWKVCRQDPGPGATDDIRVTIYAVKNHESC